MARHFAVGRWAGSRPGGASSCTPRIPSAGPSPTSSSPNKLSIHQLIVLVILPSNRSPFVLPYTGSPIGLQTLVHPSVRVDHTLSKRGRVIPPPPHPSSRWKPIILFIPGGFVILHFSSGSFGGTSSRFVSSSFSPTPHLAAGHSSATPTWRTTFLQNPSVFGLDVSIVVAVVVVALGSAQSSGCYINPALFDTVSVRCCGVGRC